jgi:RNA polymerase sigma-70 factor, ECF subfamily
LVENKLRAAVSVKPVPVISGSREDWPECWPVTPAEYEQLVDCMMQPLVRYAFRRLLSIHEAEDVVQDVLLKAFALGARRGGKPGVVSYLYKMAANACTDLYRREKMKSDKLSQGGSFRVIEGSGKTEHEAFAELERIEKLLVDLPGKQAEVIRLRIIDELSFSQISRILKVKQATVKSRFHYGIERLRKFISAQQEVE